MDDIVKENRAQGSVWGVAIVAVALFVAAVLVVGMFGSPEVAAVAVAK